MARYKSRIFLRRTELIFKKRLILKKISVLEQKKQGSVSLDTPAGVKWKQE
jgi:hypothetical protein